MSSTGNGQRPTDIPTDREVVLEARNVTKTFPGVVANKDVSLKLYRGEVLALLGENGAGKTTLMNILYGLYHQDSGEMFVRGEPVRISGPSDSISRGIGMVHQHFMLVPVFTVAENIMLGAETVKGLSLDIATVRRRIRELAAQYNLDVDPDVYVKDLSVGQQQRVEIVKALYRKADILILDEPTAVLTPQEAEDLFEVIRTLQAQGTSVIFITHKLKEVLAISDRIMVLRRGQAVGETTPEQATERSLAEMMVGRSVLLEVEKKPAQPGAVVLEIRGLRADDDRGQQVVNDVSLQVRASEIVGIAGVQGNGQTELVEAITGLRPARAGHVLIAGTDYTNAVPRAITEAGTAHVPEDRQEDGLVLGYTIADNLVLNTYYLAPFAKGVARNEAAINEHAEKLVKEYDVRTPSPFVPVGNLSGGNKQKVIIARELSRPIKLLIAAQPTRGVDVGSIEFIHKTIVAQREAGAAVLVVSAELDEVMSLADRIAVMYHGQIVAVVPADQVTREDLGLLMAGAKLEPVAS
ncbi:MAG TPA: ABC transporter ATP-binding protein [Roseiflexaceae bacterium]|nr:ABC transporter ATP-binding protein [Roseiflexaceae bacterium]